MLKITQCSRKLADRIIKEHPGRWSVISIFSPGHDRLEFDPENVKGFIYLEFDDVGFAENNDAERAAIFRDKVGRDVRPFNYELAEQVLNFIRKHKVDDILIHCEAGISRSAGLALALDEIFNSEKYQQFGWGSGRIPNMLVYKTMHKYYEDLIENNS